MGNWRTVHIHGKVDSNDVESLRSLIHDESYDSGIYALSYSKGLCGIGNWVTDNGVLNSVGNLAERDFSVEDVLNECKEIASRFPNSSFKIDCGDDYEDTNCVATIIVEKGTAKQVEAEVAEIPAISIDMMRGRLFSTLSNY